MKSISVIAIVIFFNYCSPSTTEGNKNNFKKDTILHTNGINTDTPKITNGPANFIFIDTFKIYAKLKLHIYTIDSIIAELTFYNKDRKPFLLYKPILPSDSLVEETFAILDEKMNHLQYETPVSSRKYLQNPDIIPLVIPELSNSNLLNFKPGEELNFKINLSTHYNFRQTDRKMKSKSVLISYRNLFPYVVEGAQLHLPYTGYSSKTTNAPVYFSVYSVDNAGKFERIKVRLPIE